MQSVRCLIFFFWVFLSVSPVFLSVCKDYDCKRLLTPLKTKSPCVIILRSTASSSLAAVKEPSPLLLGDRYMSVCSVVIVSPVPRWWVQHVCSSVRLPPFFTGAVLASHFHECLCAFVSDFLSVCFCCLHFKHLKSLPYKLKQVHLCLLSSLHPALESIFHLLIPNTLIHYYQACCRKMYYRLITWKQTQLHTLR